MTNCTTEVWSRVTGFMRPTGNWNKGKREEFKDRKHYKGVKDEDNKTDMETIKK